MKSSNLPYAFYEETSLIANTEDSSVIEKIGICREKLARLFLQIFEVTSQCVPVCVPNKNLMSKLVTLIVSAIFIVKIYTIIIKKLFICICHSQIVKFSKGIHLLHYLLHCQFIHLVWDFSKYIN